MTKIYILGPMRGHAYFNFPAFDLMAIRLSRLGYNPVSPANLDRQAGYDFATYSRDTDWSKLPDDMKVQDVVARDMTALLSCQGYVCLEGWENSTGARAEKAVLEWLGATHYVAEEGRLTPVCDLLSRSFIPASAPQQFQAYKALYTPSPVAEEQTITDASGGKKGVKLERFDLIPAWALEELARVYGMGEAKYPSDESGPNWRKGYKWGLSFGAMMRHCWLFWRGEAEDKQSGLHHLAHAAWHCMTLMTFWREHLGTDNRADAKFDPRWPQTTPENRDPRIDER